MSCLGKAVFWFALASLSIRRLCPLSNSLISCAGDILMATTLLANRTLRHAAPWCMNTLRLRRHHSGIFPLLWSHYTWKICLPPASSFKLELHSVTQFSSGPGTHTHTRTHTFTHTIVCVWVFFVKPLSWPCFECYNFSPPFKDLMSWLKY